MLLQSFIRPILKIGNMNPIHWFMIGCFDSKLLNAMIVVFEISHKFYNHAWWLHVTILI